jgi:hypothetical protein
MSVFTSGKNKLKDPPVDRKIELTGADQWMIANQRERSSGCGEGVRRVRTGVVMLPCKKLGFLMEHMEYYERSGKVFLILLADIDKWGLSNNAKLGFHTILANIISFLHHLFPI